MVSDSECTRICGTCKYHQHEDIDDGWVCVNDIAEACSEWTDYNYSCPDWEERDIHGRRKDILPESVRVSERY